MPTRMVLVCHAATEATRLARFPRNEDLDARHEKTLTHDVALKADRWWAGPETRTRRTAAILAGEASVVPDLDLRDWDCGIWAGRNFPDLERDQPEALSSWLSDPASAPHGGESLLELLGRIERWMDSEAARGGRSVAVTHPSILRAAMVHALAGGPASFWRVDAKPLCRMSLSHDGRRWMLQGLVPAL